MAALSVLTDAILSCPAAECVQREDVLRKIVDCSTHALRTQATVDGDSDLTRIAHCECIGRLKRLAAVNASEKEIKITYDQFVALISGVKNANSPRRGFTRNHRRR